MPRPCTPLAMPKLAGIYSPIGIYSPTGSPNSLPSYVALVVRDACLSGPHRTETVEELVLDRHCTDSRQKYNRTLPVKKYLLVL